MYHTLLGQPPYLYRSRTKNGVTQPPLAPNLGPKPNPTVMESLLLNPTLTLTDHTGTTLDPQALLGRIEQLAFCVTDAKGYFREVNDAYLELYGYTREELIGNHFTMVVPEAYRAMLRALHSDFIAGDDELPTQYTVQHKDGSLIEIVVEAVRVEDEDEGTSKLTIIDRLR